MHFGTILFLGIAVNLDNLCLGMSCGVAKKHIPWYHNLIIALVSGLFGGLSCGAARLIPANFSSISALLGSLILLCMGVQAIVQGVKKRDIVPNCSCRLTSLREICTLSVALALNCLAVSFGMGMSDVPFFLLGISIAVFSFVGVSAGNHLGENAARLVKPSWLNIISGLLLIAVAIWEWLV